MRLAGSGWLLAGLSWVGVWFSGGGDAFVCASGADAPAAHEQGDAAACYEQAFAAVPHLTAEESAACDVESRRTLAPDPRVFEPIVARFAGPLADLRRAAEAKTCDWRLDGPAGFRLQLPPLEKAIELSRAGLLRSRLRFAAGMTDEALADALAVLRMARHIGGMGLIVPFAVDARIEEEASRVVAAHLPHLDAGQLAGVAAACKTLPDTPSVADCMRREGAILGGAVEFIVTANAGQVAGPNAGGVILDRIYEAANGPQPPRFEEFPLADLQESVRLYRAGYEHLATMLDLAPAERSARLADWREKRGDRRPTDGVDRVRLLSWDMLPTVDFFAGMADRRQWNRDLLRLAIEVQRHGPAAVDDVEIPGHGRVVFRKLDDGFEIGTRAALDAAPPPQRRVDEMPPRAARVRARLAVGDPAPPLKVGPWVRGTPVTEFSRDEAYLVDFWASWCGPCLSSLPHLAEIATKWGAEGLVVVAQNVRDGNEDEVRRVAEDMDDAAGVRVALDEVAETKGGAMAAAWLDAAGCRGVPWAFLVGKDGRIAWIGHPNEIEESVIAEVLAGTFDMTKAVANHEAAREAEHRAAMVAAQIKTLEASRPDGPMLRVGPAE